jgi:hypothetical protein
MNPNEEVKNPMLLEAIEAIKNDNASKNEKNFYHLLSKARLLLPAVVINDREINIVRITDREGHDYLPAFTDWQNFSANPGEINYQAVIFSIYDYLKLIKSDDSIAAMVINPYTHNLVLARENLNYVETQVVVIEAGEEICIGAPAEEPEGLIEGLTDLFCSKPTGFVKKAYLLQMIRSNMDLSLLLVVDVENITVIPEIGKCAMMFLDPETPIDIISADAPLGAQAIVGQKPFYP